MIDPIRLLSNKTHSIGALTWDKFCLAKSLKNDQTS